MKLEFSYQEAKRQIKMLSIYFVFLITLKGQSTG